MQKVLILGADGMVGHVSRIYLADLGYIVKAIARTSSEDWICLDLEDLPELKKYLEIEKFDFIVNCVGVLIKESEINQVRAIRLNSLLPKYLESLSKDLGFKVIHASTDCVFSGNNGPYVENSNRDSYDFYGKTKALGEIINNHDLTIRTSKIGPELDLDGTGLFNWFMRQTGTIKGYGRAMWGGVTTLEYAKVIEWIIKNPYTGLIHLTNGEGISKYDLLCLIAEIWQKKNVKIERDDNHTSDRSLRSSRNDFTYKVPTYREMFLELHHFMKKHTSIYQNIYNLV